MRHIGALCLFTILAFSLSGQNWTEIDSKLIAQTGERNINPDQFITAYVDDSVIKSILWSAPDEISFDPGRDQHTLIDIMNAKGEIETFSIVRYQMMEPNLAQRYDHIRTFHGLSTNTPHRRIRITYTVHGFRAVISDEKGQTYIDHFQRNDKYHKVIYTRSSLQANEDWTCQFESKKDHLHSTESTTSRSGDCTFRSYRFAMTTTGEYSNYHGAFSEADSSLVMSAVVTTVDRVNDVLEQDLTIRLILIDNVDDIFYYDPSTDPFSGNSAGSMISQNQSNTDAVIGSANYDLGHIVSTGGSGLATLSVLCFNGLKARGVTGISTPEGDPFDIDYVAHEIGHQLGANHTQNNPCNRNNPTAMEPGSASTIMGYAGICPPNVQNNSDAYYHAISIQEMNEVIASTSCHQIISFTNSAPIVNELTNKTIPHSTPFVLDVIATDNDEDVLTYCWEQMDNEVGQVMPPSGTNTLGPMFRTNLPTTDSKRYFPNLSDLASNTSPTWEVLPTVGRSMDFRVTVRDNTFAPGCTDEQDITIDVDGNSGPFTVTSQNTAAVWEETEMVTITWDVANTNTAPVSCSNVDIFLSYDGGSTFPVALATSTPNDGSEIIEVPINTTTSGRVMVKCSNNVFFDINNADITIEEGTPSFSIVANPESGTACDNSSILFTVESTSILGYADPINISISDLPVGAVASIATNPIVPGSTTTVTLDNLEGTAGSHTLTITGSSGTIVIDTFYSLIVVDDMDVPTLVSPANEATGVLAEPTLTWQNTIGVTSYEYEVSTLPNGGNIIASGSTPNNEITLTSGINLGSIYYWRVRQLSSCGTSAWSEERTFETATCVTKSATDLPIIIPSSGTPTITSSLSFLDNGDIVDLNIINLTGTHTYVSDLNFTLIAPDGTSLDFWSDPCVFQDDFNINFDDQATSSTIPCPPTTGLTYQPDIPLSFFNSKELKGEWTLSVFDDFDDDGGSLDSWGVEICIDNYCDLTVDNASPEDIPGTLTAALNCAGDGDTITIDPSLANSTIELGTFSKVIQHNIAIQANPADNIQIISNSTIPTLTITNGKSVALEGFKLENTTSTTGVIENNGSLMLNNMSLWSSIQQSAIVNQNSGTLTIQGDCSFFEN